MKYLLGAWVSRRWRDRLSLFPLPSGANFRTDVAVRVAVVRCDSIMLQCDSLWKGGISCDSLWTVVIRCGRRRWIRGLAISAISVWRGMANFLLNAGANGRQFVSAI